MTIEAFVGLPGQGKTYQMTRLAYRKWKRYMKNNSDRKIYANYPLHLPNVIRFQQIYEVLDVTNADILIDEAALVASAYHWKHIPYEVIRHWMEHRHRGVDVWYTVQHLKMVATPLRRITQFVNECRKIGPLFIYRCYCPHTRQKYGGGFCLYSEEIGELYETHNIEGVPMQDYFRGK